MRLVPLGDAAALAECDSEAAAVRFAAAAKHAPPPWLHDAVPAYTKLGVFFDADAVDLPAVQKWFDRLPSAPPTAAGNDHIVPVCYDFPLDLPRIAETLGLPPDRVIEAHVSATYTVFAVGFVPGFPYLGYLPPELVGVPRLASPRVRVEPGCVGLTGRQTGIYPLPRPGGWPLLARTPLTLVDVADNYFPLRVGDRMTFRRIDAAEYRKLDGDRL